MVNTYTREYRIEAKDANVLEASIYYSLGGYNYFTYEQEPRGYYFSLTPYKSERGWRSYVAFSGSKMCVLPCNRQSAKRYEEAKAMMPELIERCMARFCEKNGIELLGTEYTENERERKVA